MNKQELIKNYTAEQLAEMAEKLDIASEMSAKHIYNLENKINNLEEENGRLQAKVDTYNKFLLPRCTKEARELIDRNHFVGVMIVSCGEWNDRSKTESKKVFLPKEYESFVKELLDVDASEIKDDCHRFGIESLQRYLDIDSPKEQAEIERLKSEVAKYRKYFEDAKKERDCRIAEHQNKIDELNGKLEIQTAATTYAEEYVNGLKNELSRSKTTITQIDEILEELFGITHDAAKPGEFKEILREKVSERIADFLPTEPIKIADMLIDNAAAVYESYVEDYAKANAGQLVIGNPCEDVRRQTLSYLRQIAEHLLVCCNHHEEER